MSNNAKELRGQLRQIVKDLLNEELVKAVEEKVTKLVIARLNEIQERHDKLASFIIRNHAKNTDVKPKQD